MTLNEIERLTREYAHARNILRERVQRLEDEIAALKRKLLPGIRSAVNTSMERHARLKAAVESAPGLFVKPRTQIFHGIKVGWQKGKGELMWEDPAQVCRLIRKHFPGQADMLIQIREKPLKSALAKLSVSELKKLGVAVEETGDQVVIRSADSEIDKLVNALLKDEDDFPKEAA